MNWFVQSVDFELLLMVYVAVRGSGWTSNGRLQWSLGLSEPLIMRTGIRVWWWSDICDSIDGVFISCVDDGRFDPDFLQADDFPLGRTTDLSSSPCFRWGRRQFVAPYSTCDVNCTKNITHQQSVVQLVVWFCRSYVRFRYRLLISVGRRTNLKGSPSFRLGSQAAVPCSICDVNCTEAQSVTGSILGLQADDFNKSKN